jgi:polyphosphate kinase 2 (PPK2 family)
VLLVGKEYILDKYLVEPNVKVKLSDWDANDDGDIPGGKQGGEAEFARLNQRLEELQELLYAEHKNKLLVVLQAMDTGGKDGAIRHVFDRVNPQGVRVANFKTPTDFQPQPLRRCIDRPGARTCPCGDMAKALRSDQ